MYVNCIISNRRKSVIEDKEFTDVNKITASFGLSTMGSNETLNEKY
ncbi:hypothetical protein [Candidatus Sulfurimonas baltica]|uniref:Uncharacterized protein n=1 Tax=Candidatus Sulfurimonas baltica TaxID=2740404 RepID=A0A7S7LXF9_9BACT|nr:hypothetical protein [Candidatus Sulfurimonas baltica]QOY53185.1 hypothetical protein HUE88_05770 [Candidatus Sulfurimonas baltica]